MSYQTANEPVCTGSEGPIELVIEPKAKDLGGLTVRRVLPSSKRRMVGPFVFFDHMGPAEFPPGEGIAVRPHPHIGLATVTYLFEGEIMHRDSLGFVQPIQPGAVNLMTAGRGIVHSERAGDDFNTTSRLSGIQTWMALPEEQESRDPAFVHYPAGDLPELHADGVKVRVIMGEIFGMTSPVTTYSPTLYLELQLPAGSAIELPSAGQEQAVYLVSGKVGIGQQVLTGSAMAVATPGHPMRLNALHESHVMVIGGAALGKRHIWWNFVSSSKDAIAQARLDWQQGRFDAVPGETEFIPLPQL
jgi:redox-sensitive bicupin YhaK (pirin superfamily)